MSELTVTDTGPTPTPVEGAAGSHTLLSVEDLSVAFRIGGQWRDVVRSASFDVDRGEILALVGESGSGKTVTSMALLGLIETLGGRVTGGRVTFDGEDVTRAPERRWLQLRGSRIGMIMQQPTRSLDPAFTVGDQIAETIRAHRGMSRKQAWRRAVELLDRVHIPDAAHRAEDYPHTFSGGMCQRLMIAIALSCDPQLLIADEPTTALDVTVQARILDLLREIQTEQHLSILYITHDLGVVAELCDRVTVMYAGEIVESAPVEEAFVAPRHPYTEGLIGSIPRPGRGKRMLTIAGQVPAPQLMPEGCRFHPRCEYAVTGLCTDQPVPLVATTRSHAVRCARAGDITLKGIDR